MKQRRMNRQLVDRFTTKSEKCGEIKLIAGIDPNPPDPYPNAIFYIRMESRDRNSKEPCKTESIWLSLNDMTRLSVLMNVASRFWVNRYDKGRPCSEERITDFVSEYRKIKKSLKKLLPIQRFLSQP